MNIIMLDTEYLDPKPGGVILTIGAVVIDTDLMKRTDEFYIKIDADDSMRRGCTVQPSTMRWWMDQPKEARDEAFSGKEDLQLSLAKFTNFVSKVQSSNAHNGNISCPIYSCGKEDIVLLEAAYRIVNPHLSAPWEFYDPRDFRTVRELFPWVQPRPTGGVPHHALHDAIRQAEHLIAILKEIDQPAATAPDDEL